MGLIKSTILVWIIYYIYVHIVVTYLKNNPKEAILYKVNSYMPVYKVIVALLNILRFISLIASVIWFLFAYL